MDEPPSPTTIYVSNLSEDVWPFISEISDAAAYQLEIDENATILSDRDLLALSDNDHTIAILPHAPSPEFVSYITNLFHLKNFHILNPRNHSGKTSQDIARDPELLQKLEALIKNTQKLELVAYSTSVELFELAKKLKAINPNLTLTESPEEEDSWTVNFYGSKGGIRQLSDQSQTDEPDFKMSDGMISSDLDNTAKIAAKMYSHNGGIVLKTNKGHSGSGLLIFRPGDLPNSYQECYQAILKKLQTETYWSKFPIVVEKYVEPSSVGGGFPNVEFRISKNGRVNFLFPCGLRVTKDGVFKGVEIAHDIFPDKVMAQIMDLGFFIGEKLASQGYRGYYDVDCIAGRNGQLYVTESNVRRTGGTHVYHTAVALLGKDFLYDSYILSDNVRHITPKKPFTFPKLLELFSPILFNKKTQEGIVITSGSYIHQNRFGYIIFGQTKSQALRIEAQMESILSSSS